jgi:hypothetical protein
VFLKFGVPFRQLAVRLATLEIDENLIRRDLTPAQRAKLIAKRKAAYEAVHGSAKAVGARAANRAMGRGNAAAKLADASFTADTAAKAGKPERTIQRDAARAKALGADLDRVAGTSLDRGTELDALACCRATAALVPDLTFRGDIKLNPRFRLHRDHGALASLHRTLPLVRVPSGEAVAPIYSARRLHFNAAMARASF